jgi:hypothetical protein
LGQSEYISTSSFLLEKRSTSLNKRDCNSEDQKN